MVRELLQEHHGEGWFWEGQERAAEMGAVRGAVLSCLDCTSCQREIPVVFEKGS